MSTTLTTEKPTLRSLLVRLKAYKFTHRESMDGYERTTWSDQVSCDLASANVVSSELKDQPGRHAILLDLDYPATREETNRPGQYLLTLPLRDRTGRKERGSTARDLRQLRDRLREAGFEGIIDVIEPGDALWHPTHRGRYQLQLVVTADLALTKSTTKGHRHLYVDVSGGLPEAQYKQLREALFRAHVIERAHTWGNSTYLRPPGIKKKPKA